MGRVMTSGAYSTMLQEFTTWQHMAICTSEPGTASSAWIYKGSSGAAMARSNTGVGNLTTGPGSTNSGWVVVTSSLNNIAIGCGASYNVENVCWMGGTSTGANMFCTVCTTRGLTTADTVSIPQWNIRIGAPDAS